MPRRIFGVSEFKYALFAYDVFSKKLSVTPLKNQTSQTTANSLKRIFEEDIGLPLQVYNDEGGEFVKHFSEKLKYYDVEQKTSRTPPAFVERAIRTFKEKVLKRQKTLKIKDWVDTAKFVVDQYNDTEHTTTEVAPNDAAVAKYEDVVRENIEKNATFNRKYDKVEEGDIAKVFKKPGKYSEFGFDFDHWKPGTSTVDGYNHDGEGTQTYQLSGIARPLMRHELKVVKGSEAPTLIRRRLTEKAPPRYDVR